jgi:Alginate O-acetyl transferase AlgF
MKPIQRQYYACSAILLCALFTPAAMAQDAGLYEEVADANAAYVRVIAAPNNTALVQTTSLSGLETGISPYLAIPEAGEVRITVGTTESIVTVEPGSWQTFLVAPDGTANLLIDAVAASPAQADVSFYNLSDVPEIDLFVPAAKVVAIGAVPIGQSGSVALKAPLTLDFEAREGEMALAAVAKVELRRRDAVTFVLRGSAGNYELVATPNSISK